MPTATPVPMSALCVTLMALLSQPAAGNAGPAIVPPSPPADSTPATSTPGALNCSDATLGISALPAFTSPEEECQFVVQNFEGGCLANLIGIEVFANSAECNWPVCGWTRPADTVAGVCQATCAAQPVPYGPCAPARPPSPPSAPCADLALNLPLELAPAGDPTPEQECNYALNVLQWPCALPFSAILDYLNSDICELQICAWEDVPVGVTTVGEVCQASCGARGYGVCAAASPSPPPPSPPSPPPSPPSPPSPPASPPPPPAAGSVVIFPGYNLSWVVRMAEGEIEISIDALTNGWVGFGLAELGGMPGADIMVASVSDDGIAQIGDYWASGYFTPQLDESQDWTLVSASQSDSVTSVRATRRLDTNDRQDRSFDPSLPIAHRVIAAIGATDTFVYHAERAPATVDFFNTVADPLAQIKADPNISTLSYRAPDYVIPPQCSTEYGAQAPCTGGIADCIQTCYGTETTYTEFCFPVTLPNSHIVAVEPVVDPRSSRYVHHYQVDLTSATCAERSSGGDDAAEELTIYIAARETGPLALPEAAGFRVGAGTPYSSVVITIHYDNPSAATNVVDASGIDLHYTTLLRPHDAAVLQLGDPNVLLANAPMPPGLSRWDFFCPAVATAAALTQPLTAFARFQHMHKNGARIVSTQYDATFTTLRTSATEYFDFDFQSYHAQDAQQWTISPGDQIVTACYYDTGASSDVKWGLAGQNEMCVDYVYYYPAEPRLSQCGLGVNGLIIGGAVPFQGQEPIAFFNRTFGLPGAESDCVSDADFSHPAVGKCYAFTDALCERYGRDRVNSPPNEPSSAIDACCECRYLPPTCADQTFYSVAAIRETLIQLGEISPDQPIEIEEIDCDAAGEFGVECEEALPAEIRLNNLLPDRAQLALGVCPVSCNACGADITPSQCPPGCVPAKRKRERKLLFSAIPCGFGCEPA